MTHIWPETFIGWATLVMSAIVLCQALFNIYRKHDRRISDEIERRIMEERVRRLDETPVGGVYRSADGTLHDAQGRELDENGQPLGIRIAGDPLEIEFQQLEADVARRISEENA